MPPFIQFAAHVDHGIEHTDDVGRVGLSLLGLVIGAAICSSGVGTAACLGALASWGGGGMELGKIVDDFRGGAIVERIASGLDSVRLGPGQKPAARAHDDCRPDGCTGNSVAEGSETVALGPERKPMSRKEDRTNCGGRIVEGLGTVLVGGEPSAKGQEFEELDSRPVQMLNGLIRVLGLGASIGKRGLAATLEREVRNEALDALGLGPLGDVANAYNAGLPKGGSLMDTYKQLRTLGRGLQGAQDLAAGLRPVIP